MDGVDYKLAVQSFVDLLLHHQHQGGGVHVASILNSFSWSKSPFVLPARLLPTIYSRGRRRITRRRRRRPRAPPHSGNYKFETTTNDCVIVTDSERENVNGRDDPSEWRIKMLPNEDLSNCCSHLLLLHISDHWRCDLQHLSSPIYCVCFIFYKKWMTT